MKKILIATIIVATLILGITGYFGYMFFLQANRDRDLLQENQLELVTLSGKLEQITKEKSEYRDILTDSGTLYFVGIDGSGSDSREIITESFDIIRFVNRSEQPQQVSLYERADTSGTPLAELDINANDMYPFHLKRSGVYYYQSGNQKGTIIIGEAATKDYHLSSFLEKEIFPLMQASNPSSISTAIAHFHEAINIDPILSGKCHDLAHAIGHKAFKIFGFSVAISQSETDVCAGGYTHGVLEAYFESFPEMQKNPESACETIVDAKKESCFHGVGHGLMFISKNNVAEALISCRTLSTQVWKNRCAEGVFMELYAGDPEHADGIVHYDTGALFAPCTTFGSGSESYVCGFYAGLGYLRYQSDDYTGALGACLDGGVYTNMCIAGIGKEIAKRHIGDALKLENICSTIDNPIGREKCITNGINYTKLQFEANPEIIEKYCLSFQKSQELCTGKKSPESEVVQK